MQSTQPTLRLTRPAGVFVTDSSLTNNPSPDFSGLADPGQTVTLLEVGSGTAGGPDGKTVAAEDGSWIVSPDSVLADGVHEFVVAESDGQGGPPRYSNTLLVTVDTTAPDAPTLDTGLFGFGLLGDGSLTRVARPLLRGTSEPSSTVTLFEEPVGSGGLAAALGLVPAIGTEAVGADGLWTFVPDADLADGQHEWVAMATDVAGNQSVSPVLLFTVDTVAPLVPPAPALATITGGSSDVTSTSSTKPTLVGSAEPKSIVELFDGFPGADFLSGTTTSASDGTWSYTFTSPLKDGLHEFSVEAIDAAGNVSAMSEVLRLQVQASVPLPMVSLGTKLEKGLVQGTMLTGTALPGGSVTLGEGGHQITSIEVGPTGTWAYDGSHLSIGEHSITATVTQTDGTVTQSDPARFDVQASRFTFADRGELGTLIGSDYSGPVGYLTAQLVSTSDENSVFGSSVPNVFLHSGKGDDALNVSSGSNVLDGGAGSNFLTGATGSDGGFDTFFIDGRNSAPTWDTIVNFHPHDVIDVFGFSPTMGSFAWSGDMGAQGYLGSTIKIDLGDGRGSSTLVTLANLPSSTVTVATSEGNLGDLTYLELRLA